MSVKPEIELTADGSHTLFVPSLNEHYHSVNVAVEESTHILINTGLKACMKEEIQNFEVWFGTGLNAFLTILEACKRQITIRYTSVEAYPLDKSITNKLNYTKDYTDEEKSLFYKLHEAQWNEEIRILPNLSLTKLKADFTQFDFSRLKNIVMVYFDACAPDKQPNLWTQYIFDNLYKTRTDSSVLVTYCAKGTVRRMMKQAGFTVERLPGPPGKREMLRATKNGLL